MYMDSQSNYSFFLEKQIALSYGASNKSFNLIK